MTIKREELRVISDEIERNEAAAAKIHESCWRLMEKSNTIISQIIIEEELLSNTNWNLEGDVGSALYLEYQFDAAADDKIKSLTEIIRKNNQRNFEMEEGVNLYCDDNRFTIRFDDPKLLPLFVKKMKLNLDNATVISKLHALKREVKALESTYHILGI